ncbi:MAG: hypothetical protein GXP27_04070 [Planctomycetes bacterium]|nr:hypothetical protein [Planctomycetota bacterium]
MPRHDFEPAWDLGAQLTELAGRLVFFTDQMPEPDVPIPARMEIVAIGRPMSNVAFTAARWTVDPGTQRGRLYLRVRHFGSGAVSATISGTARGQQVFAKRLSLPADRDVPLEAELAGGIGQMTIRVVASGDSLAVDDVLTLIEPKVRLVTVVNRLPADSIARYAVKRVLQALPDVQPGELKDADLLIEGADQGPPDRIGLWWLGVGPIDPSDAARKQAKNVIGPYLLEKRHPLLEGVTLGGVVWGGVQPVPWQATPLISVGGIPLLARLSGTASVAYLLNIDLRQSNLADSPDWPILLSNLIDQRRQNLPGLAARWNYRLNEPIRFRLFELGAAGGAGRSETDGSRRELTLAHGDRRRPVARSAIVELPPLDAPGLYTIQDGDHVIDRFAVNFFDVRESDLRKLGRGHRSPPSGPEIETVAANEAVNPAIIAGIVLTLLAALADWHIVKRKRLPA